MHISKQKGQSGQAVFFFILGLTFFLLGAVGLGIDGAHLYAQYQMAQAAADAAAEAGIMSLYDNTNLSSAPHYFDTSSSGPYTCAASAAGTPCYYAQTLNGFNSTSTSDTVTYEPNPSGVSISNLSSDSVNRLRVTVSRTVPTTLMRLLGPPATTVSASGTAAIVNVLSPVPIIVTHPTMAGALNMNGNTSATICGGPQKSIQVNSSGTNPAGAAFVPPSSGNVDLRKAGPADPGNCTVNGGGDFGTFGGPTTQPGSVLLGSGHYLASSPIQDPLAGVSPPSVPATTPPANGQSCSILGHCSNCPAPQFAGAAPASCTEYLPGLYTGGLNIQNVSSGFFDPGVYYMKGGGFSIKNSTVQMCSSCGADPNTMNGMLVYDTCSTAPSCSPGSDSTGGFAIYTGTYAVLIGAGVTSSNPTASPAAPYYGIAFFEDRNANAQTHNIGAGNGCFSIVGTVYITNTLGIMQGDATHYQSVLYHGTPCSSTNNVGEIIVSQLTIEGTSGLNMSLFPTPFLKIRQVALVQ